MIKPIFELKLVPKDKLDFPEIIYIAMRLEVPTMEDALQYAEKHYPNLNVEMILEGYKQV